MNLEPKNERPTVVIVESNRRRNYRPGRSRYPWWKFRRRNYRGFSHMGSLWYRLGLVVKTVLVMLQLFIWFLVVVYILGS